MIDENWWPEPLKDIFEENPLADTHVIVAEISKPLDSDSLREFNTALVPPEFLSSVLESSGGIEHEVTTPGPHPSPYRGNFHYQPYFRIQAGIEGIKDGFEPLVVSWEAGENKVWLPDQGFLMTYGLVPRLSNGENQIYWDDPGKPKYGVVICKPLSIYSFELKEEARVLIDKEYLQDYAKVRNRSLVQVYYACNNGLLSPEILEILDNERSKDVSLKGRLVNLCVNHSNNSEVIAQVWGSRGLIDPKDSPVIEGRWDYRELIWPGIKEPITKNRARSMTILDYVYVRDSVLEKYEVNPQLYEIDPEYGSVRYKNQWGVSHCCRICRDLIQIELKKLYEGIPPDVVKHFHQHAVEPPPKPLYKKFKELNIGTRSKKIVYNLVELGEILAEISNLLIEGGLNTSMDFVKLKRSDLDYEGWWQELSVRLITKHIPLEMGENVFMERCRDLNSLIVEGLNEKNLRKTLLKTKVDKKSIEGLRCLKLLDIFIQYGIIVEETGLDFISSASEIEKRRIEKISNLKKGEYLPTPLQLLFALNDLRNAASHRKRDIAILLDRAGIKKDSVKSGWGYELDRLYDRIADSLQDAARIISALLE